MLTRAYDNVATIRLEYFGLKPATLIRISEDSEVIAWVGPRVSMRIKDECYNKIIAKRLELILYCPTISVSEIEKEMYHEMECSSVANWKSVQSRIISIIRYLTLLPS